MSKRQLPTPDEWNHDHPARTIKFDMAPVRCPKCSCPMWYERADALHSFDYEQPVVCRCGYKTQINM